MSVNPSPIGGFAAQFFDNNGQPLSGGKIYTYAAGTTTPQATYTSAVGITPHANPIVLDSAGRVPGGEIWLTDSLIYKFVIETSLAVLIGTYDNITGVNSNFVNYTVQEEVITATAGQTVFNLSTINYTPGTNSLSVYIDGVNQYVGDSYLETDSNTVTFTSGLHVGAEVKFTTAVQTTTGAVDANDVGYTYPATGAVGQTVQTRLEQYVSVKDFGAVGDGVTDDTAAILAALTANVGPVQLVNGETYLITGFTIPAGATLFGSATLLLTNGKVTLSNNVTLKDFTIDGDSKGNADHALYANAISNITIDGVHFTQIGKSGLDATGVTNLTMVNCTAYEIGDPGVINVTSEGCFVHLLNCSNVNISQNNRIERTYGHAAIFVRENVVDCSVTNNAIYDTFFRGIQVYSLGHGRVLVANNRIYRTGEINNTGSGIACNGIYIVTGNTDPATLLVIGNHVEKCAENGIEALGGCTVIGNVVKTTGYRSLTTPSKEGIFLAEGAVVKHNTIVDAFDHGIRNYADYAETKFVIEGNTIVNSGGDGINCQADTAGGSFTNCHVTNNTIISFGGTWGIAFGPTAGGTVGNTNSVSGNIIPVAANAAINGTPRQFGNSWQSTLTGTSVVDPPNLASGASQQFTVTVTGAATTNTATASFSQKNADIYWTADVTSANTVTVTQFNRGVGAVDLGSGTLTVYVDRS